MCMPRPVSSRGACWIASLPTLCLIWKDLMSYEQLITRDAVKFLVTEGRSTVARALECVFDGRDANRAPGGACTNPSSYIPQASSLLTSHPLEMLYSLGSQERNSECFSFYALFMMLTISQLVCLHVTFSVA